MLDYERRVEEERLMWQPAVDEEARQREAERRVEEAKKKRWRAAFPVISSCQPGEGVTLHADGSRVFNQLLLMREADREWCREHRYKLTPAILVAELLRFIDATSGSCSSSRTAAAAAPPPEEPLYSTVGQELVISKLYQPVRDTRGRKRHGFNVLATGMFYLDTRLQLDNIQVFIDETRRAEQTGSHWIPQSVKALASFAQRFMIDHKTEMNGLQRAEIDSIPKLHARTTDTRGRVDLVYKLVEQWRGETRWDHAKVDKLWAYVFSFTIEPLVIMEYQAPLLARLQSDLLFVFLLFADNLYSFGASPQEMNDEFVFYEPPEAILAAVDAARGGAAATAASLQSTVGGTSSSISSTLLQTHRSLSSTSTSLLRASGGVNECRVALREASCRLWNSDDFLSSMLTGVQTRARLGPLDSLERVFSDAFEEKLAEAGAGGGLRSRAPLSFVTIRAGLLGAARSCTHALSEQFMAEFSREQRLSSVLKDAKSIFTGAAMCAYAGSLRGGAARTIEVREAFSRSLADAKMPMERRKRWAVDTEEKYGRIACKLEWPLGYVLHPPLLGLLGDTRHFLLNLLRCSEIVMDIQCDVEHPVAEDCRRPFLLLIKSLLQLTTVITELFYKQAQLLVDRYFARIDDSTTVDEARGHADSLHDRLRDLVGSSGIRKMVRDLIDMFCKMAEEIQLFLLSGKITSMEVYQWSKAVERERSMLISMGENMTNNVLADLVTMIRLR